MEVRLKRDPDNKKEMQLIKAIKTNAARSTHFVNYVCWEHLTD